MGKNNSSIFVCQQCGNEFGKWAGQCSFCKEWNSLIEVSTSRILNSGTNRTKNRSSKNHKNQIKPIKVSEINNKKTERFSTGIEELDRVFGSSEIKQDRELHNNKSTSSNLTHGIVSGSVTLLSGEPGMGKSTLLSQLALRLLQKKYKVQNKDVNKDRSVIDENKLKPKKDKDILYVCGEESPEQVKMRLKRLSSSKITPNNNLSLPTNAEGIYLFPETSVENIVDHIIKNKNKYQLIIIDSIQSIVSENLSSFAGSIGQVRECGLQLTQVFKETKIAGILVGHVTKDGSVAGPKTLEHMVDAVFRIEGERTHDLRIVRSLKNRFGTTDEVGVFRMSESGLIEISNSADVFLEQCQAGEPGSIITAILEGSRVMLLEVQALVLKTNLAMPRRVANGVKPRRLQMILAVLQKQLNIRLGEMDVFINVAGGVTIDEPGADLAIALAILSSVKNKSIEAIKNSKNKNQNSRIKTVVFGELGLLGEIRPVLGSEKRIRTAQKLGYTNVIGVKEKRLKGLISLF